MENEEVKAEDMFKTWCPLPKTVIRLTGKPLYFYYVIQHKNRRYEEKCMQIEFFHADDFVVGYAWVPELSLLGTWSIESTVPLPL
jgi:hypothetical protein